MGRYCFLIAGFFQTDATGHCRLITSGDGHGVSDAGGKGCESKKFKDIGIV